MEFTATFEAWVFPTVSLSGWRTILQKEAAAYYFTASSDGGVNQPASGGTFNGACCASVNAVAPLSANTWTHVAATYSGSQLIIYVNGAQVATLAQSGAYQQNANPLWMGGNSPLDNVRHLFPSCRRRSTKPRRRPLTKPRDRGP